MTWVKSRLLRPDATPMVGHCVTATLLVRPGWLSDRTGQVRGVVRTNTDATGLWRLDLMPHTMFEVDEFAFYEINEGREIGVSYIRVPPAGQPEVEYWLRDLLVAPPLPSDPTWNPITTLGRLFNVDAQVDAVPPGVVLGTRGGIWGMVPNSLAELVDTDYEAIAAAQPGDQLVVMPNGKWGVFKGPFNLAVEWTADDDYPTGVWLTVYGSSTLGARVQWGDGTAPTDVMPDEPVRHVYPPGGATYTVIARDKAYPLVHGGTTVVTGDVVGGAGPGPTSLGAAQPRERHGHNEQYRHGNSPAGSLVELKNIVKALVKRVEELERR